MYTVPSQKRMGTAYRLPKVSPLATPFTSKVTETSVGHVIDTLSPNCPTVRGCATFGSLRSRSSATRLMMSDCYQVTPALLAQPPPPPPEDLVRGQGERSDSSSHSFRIQQLLSNPSYRLCLHSLKLLSNRSHRLCLHSQKLLSNRSYRLCLHSQKLLSNRSYRLCLHSQKLLSNRSYRLCLLVHPITPPVDHTVDTPDTPRSSGLGSLSALANGLDGRIMTGFWTILNDILSRKHAVVRPVASLFIQV